jgi:BASS family bile acid:Na+ symporter
LQNPKPVLTGITAQMVLLPLLAWALLSPLGLPAEIFVGFMILALSPGGTTSNLFSWFAGGNLPLSISLTAVVSLITPLTIPLIGGWILASTTGLNADIHLPLGQTIMKLLVVTVLPVALGMLLRRYRESFCARHAFWMARIPFIMLLLVIGGIIYQNLEKMPWFISQTGVPALLLATLALAAGYLFARAMKQSERNARTIAIETSIQNGGTAILVTGTILHNQTMTIAPVMYGILMLLPMFAYLLWLNRKRTAPAT